MWHWRAVGIVAFITKINQHLIQPNHTRDAEIALTIASLHTERTLNELVSDLKDSQKFIGHTH